MRIVHSRVERRLAPDESHTALIAATAIFLVNLFLAISFVWMGVHAVATLTNSTVHTPQAKRSAGSFDPANTLRLIVKSDGAVHVDDRTVPDSSIESVVKDRNPQQVILQVDRRVSYQRVKAVMDVLAAAGVKSVTYAVTDEATPEPNRPAATPPPAPPGTPERTGAVRRCPRRFKKQTLSSRACRGISNARGRRWSGAARVAPTISAPRKSEALRSTSLRVTAFLILPPRRATPAAADPWFPGENR